MSAATGRLLIIRRDGVVVAAAVSKSMTGNNEAVDITSDDDEGFRLLLEASGTRSIDLSVEGVLVDDVLMNAALDPTTVTLIKECTITLPSGAVITGNFRLNSFETSGETTGRADFTATMQSTGIWAIT